MAGHFVEPAMLIPQILICSLLFGFDCYCERKATIKPHGIQCAFLRMLTLNLISNQVEIKVAFLSCIFKDSRYINTYTLKENPTSYNNNSWEIEFERMLLTDQINKSNE